MSNWQDILNTLFEAIDTKGHTLTPWEMEFLADINGKNHENLSPKVIVVKLWEKS